ncbi:MAG: CoA-binding protein [Acidobacteria bacterium]|nr:CoA-binding protein [Acidobacteriota bacterium]
MAGVSRQPQQAANAIYRKLRDSGFVLPVNPNATEAEGVRCYPNLPSIPELFNVQVFERRGHGSRRSRRGTRPQPAAKRKDTRMSVAGRVSSPRAGRPSPGRPARRICMWRWRRSEPGR